MPEGPPTAEAIQAWLVSKLSERLEIEPREIDIREPFASYGLGSTEAVSLAGELAAWLGRKLSPALVYEYATIEALARHLAGSSDAPESAAESGRDRETENEPIAIIGIGCRFPGANGPDEFWQMLRNGVDAIREVPADRFDRNAFYDPDPAAPGKMNTRWGGFLEQVDQFDPGFFGISRREALCMDPQQRLLLEVAWEALQDAGQVPERLAGTPAGVFIGIATNDYGRLQWNDLERIDAYAGTGNALSIAANRISYSFDFRGPSLAIDTACSSSLVAVHLACRSLRNGEATLALAGGANLILSPAIAINFTKAGAMAPDGRCKAFDARANGYVRSEGAGIVVLKPLAKALSDRDPIYAVIRGSAVNQDGRSNGLMAPNPLAQEAVLREAYRQAGVAPGIVQYVEAHGTGTLLGDPIEAKALGNVLGVERLPGHRCALGSVKTNLGHLEAAAGIAGLIKLALALRHREIPPSLHFEHPNPHIPFQDLPLRVQTELAPWPSHSGPAVAGVSSFGFGGTNAHVVLGEAPAATGAARIAARQIGTHLLPLSARSPEALRAFARTYVSFLALPEIAAALPDICYTAGVRLNHHDHRLAAAGSSSAQLIESLEAFLRGEARPGLSTGRKPSAHRRKLVFVFPGQGSQWLCMGQGLLAREAVFREVIERCDRAMRAYGDWSLIAELSVTDAAQSRLGEVDVVQPALFAVQIALAALWRSWGIEPDAVVGHSLGEVAAAHVAGALSFDDAIRVVCHRSRLFKRTVGRGAMAAVDLSIEDARNALTGFEDLVSIAASNGPASTVLSGDPAALAAILDQLQRRDVFCRMVKVDFASHSPQMDPLRADFLEALEGLQPRPESLPIYSTVTGKAKSGMEFDPLYWARNMREPVLFAAATQRLAEEGHDIFLEISPHPILLSALQQGFHRTGAEATGLPTLRRDEDEGAVLAGSLGALYALGYPVDWNRIYPAGGQCVRLPSYPWQRERCWLEPSVADTGRGHAQIFRSGQGRISRLGPHFESPHPAGTHFWETTLSASALPYLNDHRIQGVPVLPAAGYLEMALAAAAEVFGDQSIELRDVAFRKALFLPEGGTRTVQVILSQGAQDSASFYVYSCAVSAGRSEKSWTMHATGIVRLRQDGGIVAPDAARESLAELQARSIETISGPDYYRKLSESGVGYGPYFQSVVQLWRNNGGMLGEIHVRETPEAELEGFQLHPAILDAGLQILGAAVVGAAAVNGRQGIYLPTRIGQFRLHGHPGRHLWGRAKVQPVEAGIAVGDIELRDEAGRVAVEIEGLRFDFLDEIAQSASPGDPDDWLYEFQWKAKERAAENSLLPAGRASWLIFADRGGVGAALSVLLEGIGERSVLVAHGDSYERTDATHFRIRSERPQDVNLLFEEALAGDLAGCRGIVHLWSLDAAGPDGTTEASLAAAQTLGCGSALLLAQQLARTESPEPPRLWLITRGAQDVGEKYSPLSVAQSPMWGLGRVMAQEHPNFWGGLVDLEGGASPRADAARELLSEITGGDEEDQIAFRQGRRYVGRLVRPASLPPVPPLRLRRDATYLISGGLGDLGLLVARWMVEQGACRLILLGRTKLPARTDWNSPDTGSRLARQIAAIRDLESLGASIHLAPVDVADEPALSGFLDAFRREGWPPIRGVVHAAGVLQDGLLVQLDAAALNSVLRPKMIGGWLLHRLLQDEPLDFFALFSSAGAVLGQPGQGNYAAANTFLDALAHHRQALGKPALSINWGAWAGAGFADSVGGKILAARLALLGIGSIAPERALELLGRLLGQGASQVIAVPVDWKRLRELYPAGSAPPLLSEIAREETKILRPDTRTNEKRDALLAAGPEKRRKMLESYLSEQVARVLGLSPSKLDPRQPLGDLGLDSLMAVELKNRIAVDLGVNVPVAKFLQGFCVEQAVAQVFDQLAAEATNPAMLPVPAAALSGEQQRAERMLADLDQLSDEQVDALLTEMMGNEAAVRAAP